MIVASVLFIFGVAAFADAGDRNLALNKPTTLSSSYPGHGGEKAVDGRTDNWHPYCFYTHVAENNWFLVDLEHIFNIREIKLFNTKSRALETKTIMIMVGNNLDDLKEVGYSDGPIGAVRSFVMPSGTRGRYVEIVQMAYAQFHLCEVKVLGS